MCQVLEIKACLRIKDILVSSYGPKRTECLMLSLPSMEDKCMVHSYSGSVTYWVKQDLVQNLQTHIYIHKKYFVFYSELHFHCFDPRLKKGMGDAF